MTAADRAGPQVLSSAGDRFGIWLNHFILKFLCLKSHQGFV